MSLRTSEARRAEVASTRRKAQCAIEGRKAAGGARTRPKGVRSAGTPRRRRRERCEDTEHRASEAQSGAKTRSDHAELRGGRTASALCAHRRPEGLKWRAHEAKRSAQSKAAKRLEARGAHEARALWAKQRVVSPMRQGAPQASLRAMRNDHAELWPRPKGVRSAGTPRRRRRERCEDTEHRASVSAGRCEDAERPLRIEGGGSGEGANSPATRLSKRLF